MILHYSEKQLKKHEEYIKLLDDYPEYQSEIFEAVNDFVYNFLKVEDAIKLTRSAIVAANAAKMSLN
jgi:protein involved in ribonucleotide reduction